jgi:hypothetical protein
MLPSRRVRRLPRQRHRPLTASGGKGFHLHLRRRAVKTVGATNITIMVLPRSHLTIVTKGTTMMPKAHNRTKTVVGHATKAPPTRCCSPHRPPATATGGGGGSRGRHRRRSSNRGGRHGCHLGPPEPQTEATRGESGHEGADPATPRAESGAAGHRGRSTTQPHRIGPPGGQIQHPRRRVRPTPGWIRTKPAGTRRGSRSQGRHQRGLEGRKKGEGVEEVRRP